MASTLCLIRNVLRVFFAERIQAMQELVCSSCWLTHIFEKVIRINFQFFEKLTVYRYGVLNCDYFESYRLLIYAYQIKHFCVRFCLLLLHFFCATLAFVVGRISCFLFVISITRAPGLGLIFRRLIGLLSLIIFVQDVLYVHQLLVEAIDCVYLLLMCALLSCLPFRVWRISAVLLL